MELKKIKWRKNRGKSKRKNQDKIEGKNKQNNEKIREKYLFFFKSGKRLPKTQN